MAVPKGKVSKQRRNKRRSSVWKLAAPTLVACAKCGVLKPIGDWPEKLAAAYRADFGDEQ